MHIHWVFKIFYRVLIKRLKQRLTLLLATHELYAKDNIPEKRVGCNLSQLCGSTDCLPSLLLKGAQGGKCPPSDRKTNHSGSPEGSAGFETGRVGS